MITKLPKPALIIALFYMLTALPVNAQFKLILEDPLTSKKEVEGEELKESTKGSFSSDGWQAEEQGGQLLIKMKKPAGLEGAFKVDVTNLNWGEANSSGGLDTKMHFINMFSTSSGDHHFEDVENGEYNAMWTLRGGAGDEGEARYGNNFKFLYASSGAKRAPNSDYHEITSSAPDNWKWSENETYTFFVVWSSKREKITVSVNNQLFYEAPWANQIEPLQYIFLGSANDYSTMVGPVFSNLRIYEASPKTKMVEKWDVFEGAIANHNDYENKYEDVQLNVTYTRPDGSTVDFWGFYAQQIAQEVWRFRFMPDQIGTWKYEATFSDNSKTESGTFEVVPSSIPGMIHQDEANPMWFGYKGGNHELIRSFHVGDRFFANKPNTITGEEWNKSMRKEFLDWIQQHNYNMLSIASFYLNRKAETRGLGWDTPDLWDSEKQLPNSSEYGKMEEILNDLKDRRLLIYPFAGFFGKKSDFPKDPQKQELYIAYTLARIAPYWNQLFLVGGPEPLYNKNPHLSGEEVIHLGKLIDSLDIFNHLLSVHNPTGDDPFMNEPWLNYGVLQGPKTIDRQELSQGLLKNHHPEKPLYAQETLWPGNIYGHPDFGLVGIRKNAFVITMSAAAINFADMNGNSSSGFSGKLDFDELHPEYHEAIRRVWDFFEEIPFYEMKPRQDLVENAYLLANEGEQYLAYLEKQGTVKIHAGDNQYHAVWINPQNPSDIREIGMVSGEVAQSSPADGDDWLIYLMSDKDRLNDIVARLSTLKYKPLAEIQYTAVRHFEYPMEDFAPYYKDKRNRDNYLAIDPMKYEDQWASAEMIFQGNEDFYEFTITTYKEYDGESKYKIFVNDKVIAEFQNPPIAEKADEGDYWVTIKNVELKPSDKIMVQSCSHSNKKLPEEGAPGGYGWSRGRWKFLEIR